MIYLNHKEFEKLSSATLNILKRIVEKKISPIEMGVIENRFVAKTRSGIENSIYEDKKKNNLYKISGYNTSKLPKVDKTGLKLAKTTTLDDEESHSLRRVINRSHNPEKLREKLSKSTEPIYAGGNVASNIRGVMRSENKKMNEMNKKKYGRTAQGYIAKK